MRVKGSEALDRRQHLTFLLLLLLWRLELGSSISFPRPSAPKGVFGSFKNPGSEACSVMCMAWVRGAGEGEKRGSGHLDASSHLREDAQACGGGSLPGCGGCPSALLPLLLPPEAQDESLLCCSPRQHAKCLFPQAQWSWVPAGVLCRYDRVVTLRAS